MDNTFSQPDYRQLANLQGQVQLSQTGQNEPGDVLEALGNLLELAVKLAIEGGLSTFEVQCELDQVPVPPVHLPDPRSLEELAPDAFNLSTYGF